MATQAYAGNIGVGTATPTTVSDPDPFQDSTIAIYNSAHQLLASQNLDFALTGLNVGLVEGFTDSTADISYFTLTDNYISITDLTVNGVVESMPTVNYFGTGPETFGSGITWSSTNASNQGGSVYGYTGEYGFITSTWNDFTPMAGLNDSFAAYGVTDTMTFAFASPVSSVYGCTNMVGSGNNSVDSNCSVAISTTPEPGSLGLMSLAVGGLGLGLLRRRKRAQRA
jgi:hypothetical protein